jgi:hypothetical protein
MVLYMGFNDRRRRPREPVAVGPSTTEQEPSA